MKIQCGNERNRNCLYAQMLFIAVHAVGTWNLYYLYVCIKCNKGSSLYLFIEHNTSFQVLSERWKKLSRHARSRNNNLLLGNN